MRTEDQKNVDHHDFARTAAVNNKGGQTCATSCGRVYLPTLI
jgi:hypothetical protein